MKKTVYKSINQWINQILTGNYVICLVNKIKFIASGILQNRINNALKSCTCPTVQCISCIIPGLLTGLPSMIIGFAVTTSSKILCKIKCFLTLKLDLEAYLELAR